MKEKERRESEGEPDDKAGIIHVDFTARELYRELVKEKQGEKTTNEADAKKRESMKTYLK